MRPTYLSQVTFLRMLACTFVIIGFGFSIVADAQTLTGVKSRKTHAVTGIFDLPLDTTQAIGGVADDAASADIAERAAQMKGVREEIVAEQDAGLIAPTGVDRGDMAAGGGAVENVVVNEGGGVDHFRDHGDVVVNRVRLPERFADEDANAWPHSLSGKVPDV